MFIASSWFIQSLFTQRSLNIAKTHKRAPKVVKFTYIRWVRVLGFIRCDSMLICGPRHSAKLSWLAEITTGDSYDCKAVSI
jgi:hypothetical protein